MSQINHSAAIADIGSDRDIVIENRHTVRISIALVDDQLCGSVDGRLLSMKDSNIDIRNADQRNVEIVIEPFIHEGRQFHVFAVSVGPGGEFTPWVKYADGTVRHRMAPEAPVRFTVIASDDAGEEIRSRDNWPICINDPM